MKVSNTLFCTSKFPWAGERTSSKCIDILYGVVTKVRQSWFRRFSKHRNQKFTFQNVRSNNDVRKTSLSSEETFCAFTLSDLNNRLDSQGTRN